MGVVPGHVLGSLRAPGRVLQYHAAGQRRLGRLRPGAGRPPQRPQCAGHRFGLSYPALLTDGDACLLLAVDGEERLGYLLGFRHLTFYANGPVAWVEEVFVRGQDRGRGIGRTLMSAFERWAAARDCGLIALATRRAAPFYRALGFEESAVYFRRILDDQARQ